MERTVNELRVPLEDVAAGKVLILPLGRNDEIWHTIVRLTKFGEMSTAVRRSSYESMAMYIAAHGDDGNFFGSKEEADARAEEIKRGNVK